MTALVGTTPLDQQQHIVLDEISWELYEKLLEEIGNRPLRVTFDQGRLEIMSPLPKNERWGSWIGRLIELLALEKLIRIEPLGSTTFRSRLKRRGLEPDECYYIQNADQALQIEDEFDPAIHAPPDLAIEIDITSRSVPREPIYAALGVPELWRFDGSALDVLHLGADGAYQRAGRSLALPFLPIEPFTRFILRRTDPDQLAVLREFQAWVRQLPG
jgi:Uma2 family endonuclease